MELNREHHHFPLLETYQEESLVFIGSTRYQKDDPDDYDDEEFPGEYEVRLFDIYITKDLTSCHWWDGVEMFYPDSFMAILKQDGTLSEDFFSEDPQHYYFYQDWILPIYKKMLRGYVLPVKRFVL